MYSKIYLSNLKQIVIIFFRQRQTMRKYVRKTNRGVDQVVMEAAAQDVLQKDRSVRSAALAHNIPRSSLLCFLKKKQMADARGGGMPTIGYRNGRQVFTPAQEAELFDYLLQAGKIYYGSSRPTLETRKLAYEFADVNVLQTKILKGWSIKKVAGQD